MIKLTSVVPYEKEEHRRQNRGDVCVTELRNKGRNGLLGEGCKNYGVRLVFKICGED